MKRTKLVDEFFTNQPPWKFTKELQNYTIPKISFAKEQSNGFVYPKEIKLEIADFFGEGLLETSFDDFCTFLFKNGISGEKFPLVLHREENFEKEEFSVSVGLKECILSASEREGIRHGLFFIEDLLLQNGGGLPIGTFRKKTVIKSRISRCFFSPTNRPPRNQVELDDDVDYYPDGYLNRLAHDGINGVWIYSDFDALVHSSYITEFGQGSERRIEKLNRTIQKCARYGIKVYLFLIEPISLSNGSIVKKHGNLLGKYPQTHGNVFFDKYTKEVGGVAFCTYTDFGKNYCIDAVEKLFTLVPDLAGLICITQGERLTTCSTVPEDQEMEWTNTCPNCSKYSKPEILAQKVDILREGMRRLNPNAKFISWTYEHRLWKDGDIAEYIEKTPSDVVLMQNFEDNGRVVQLGKMRQAIDYWLAYAGPSDMFETTAALGKKSGKEVYAKMQVCCSHEVASLPYVPVPGLIYDKFTRAKALGVTGVVESWYFGNYPSLMSKAAGMLSTDEIYESKEAFLLALAKIYYPATSVKKAVAAWSWFEKAYMHCPVNIMFSYYGPLHDGIVWDLALKPRNFSPPRSWQLSDKTDGDRIGEFLFGGHTLAEATQLLCQMDEDWKKGMEVFSEITDWGCGREQFVVAKAMGLLINSCKNVLQFYLIRQRLGYGEGDSASLLEELEIITHTQIENCQKMIPLCEQDNRLGFHSEAEGFKFFPEKLKYSISRLEVLLKTEFPEVRARIDKGLPALGYYVGEELDADSYQAGNDLNKAEWRFLSDGDSAFRIAVTEESVQLELKSSRKIPFMICNEFELFMPSPTMIIMDAGKVKPHKHTITHQSLFDEKIETECKKWRVETLARESGTHLKITLNKREVNFKRLPYRCMIKTMDGAYWCQDETSTASLGKGIMSPGDFGWIITK